MPIHDWTRVDAGIFHDFHNGWIIHLREVLNGGLLPRGYYALSEQHAGQYIADILTLHTRPEAVVPAPPPGDGGVAVAEAPPRVRRRLTVVAAARMRRRTLTIRHVSGHRIVALIEIVSPANKDRAEHVEEFAAKAVAALGFGVHLLLIDLFPPGLHDPQGMPGAVWQLLCDANEPYEVPDEPLTLTSFVAGPQIEMYQEHLAVEATLPDMPLFLRQDRYVNLPLQRTYDTAFHGTPEFWRDVLEAR